MSLFLHCFTIIIIIIIMSYNKGKLKRETHSNHILYIEVTALDRW